LNIDWVIPCRFVEVHDNLGTLVGAGIDTFWLPTLPAEVAIAMALRLTATADELGPSQPHSLRNIIREPGGEPVSDVTGEFTTEASGARAEWLNGIMLSSVIRFEVAQDGTYAFELVVDGGSTATVPLHVVHGAPPGAARGA